MIGLAFIAIAAANLPTPDTPVIVIDNQGCERRCPVFRLELFGNGRALYDGKAYVRTARRIWYNLPPRQVRDWQQALIALPDGDVGCLTASVDRGATVIQFIDGPTRRTIVDNRGCDDPRAGAVRRILTEIAARAGIRRLTGAAPVERRAGE